MYSPKEIAENFITVGINKSKLPILKMIILGMLAGMFIGLAGIYFLIELGVNLLLAPVITRLIAYAKK